jgi:hypothetical protein
MTSSGEKKHHTKGMTKQRTGDIDLLYKLLTVLGQKNVFIFLMEL